MRTVAFAIVASYLLYIALPPGTLPLQEPVRRVSAPLRGWVGFVQDWRMFAPDPVAQTQRLRVEAMDDRGVRHTVFMPEGISRWGWSRDRLEHERKWIENYLSMDANAALREQAGQWFRRRIESAIRSEERVETQVIWLQLAIERRVVPALASHFELYRNDLDYGHAKIIHTWERKAP
jgi:hypothetical protein